MTDWIEHRELVLKTLTDLQENQEKLADAMHKNQVELLKLIHKMDNKISILQVKAGFLGLVAGSIPVLVMLALKYL